MPPSVCLAIPNDGTTPAADLQTGVSFGNLNEVDEHPWVGLALMLFDYARVLATKFRISPYDLDRFSPPARPKSAGRFPGGAL